MTGIGMATVLMMLQQPPPAAPPKEAPKPAGDLLLSLSLDKSSCVLGDVLQAEVSLANNGDRDADLVPLCFEERSVSFEITFAAAPGKSRTFRYAVTRPDPHLVDRLPLPRVSLKPKKSMVSLFGIPTLAPGDMTVTARYGDRDLRSAPVAVKVEPQADGANRLAAILETSEGTIQIDLLPAEAPLNVANFITLARRGFYDNMTFFRVVKDNWIQSGCPYDNGFGGPGYAVKSEAKDQTVGHTEGAVAMAQNLKADHTGSQFFIDLKAIPSFDRKYTVIGKVAGPGLEVARKIGGVSTDSKTDRPLQDVLLKKVTIVAVK